MKRLVTATIVLLAFLAPLLQAQPRSFSKRIGFNVKGDMKIIGNVVMQPQGSSTNNDYLDMRHVDVDSDPATFNSSGAQLTIPVSKDSILFAGLYWHGFSKSGYSQSGVPANSDGNKNKVRFRAASGTYAEYTATQLDYMTVTQPLSASYRAYQGFIDVTTVVQASQTSYGSTYYYAANIVTPYDETNVIAGWALVVIYKNFAVDPSRNMVVFDGFVNIASGGPDVNINLSGFKTPPTGTVFTKVGAVTLEGDLGWTQDRLRLGPTAYLSDGQNPSTNFFNSSISELGTRITAKNPDYTNNRGYDIDVVAANNILPNNATSTTIRLETGSDQYYPGVIIFATEYVGPSVQVQKLFYNAAANYYDDEHTVGLPGSVSDRTVQYHFEINNSGDEAALALVLTDNMPQYQSYIAGSMEISTNGTTWTSLSDASDADAGYYDAINKKVIIGIGDGATSGSGGTLPVGAAATRYARFKTLVSENPSDYPNFPDIYIVPNYGDATYSDAANPPNSFETNSNGATLTIDNALPVQLTSFTARANSENVQLAWKTATEINNYGFEIERRSERSDWSKIGFAEGAGSSNSPRSYSFTDNAAARQGTALYYRLKQIDRDGIFTYSATVEITFRAPVSLSIDGVYPNPAQLTSPVVIQYSVSSPSLVRLSVYDLYGREVSQLVDGMHSIGSYSVALTLGPQSHGTYYITLSDGSRQIMRRVQFQ